MIPHVVPLDDCVSQDARGDAGFWVHPEGLLLMRQRHLHSELEFKLNKEFTDLDIALQATNNTLRIPGGISI